MSYTVYKASMHTSNRSGFNGSEMAESVTDNTMSCNVDYGPVCVRLYFLGAISVIIASP